MDDDEDVPIEEGMAITTAEGDELGTLSALLVAEDEDEAEFILMRVGDTDRLVPFEAVLGVGDGNLVLDVPKENVARFPAIRPDVEPTEAEMELSYRIYDEGASEVDDEDDD